MKKLSFNDIEIVITERSDGSMSLTQSGSLGEEAKNILPKLNLKENEFACLKQTHSNKVVLAQAGGIFAGDGILSSKVKAVGIKSADCLPLMFSDGDYIGGLHVSRINLLNGIFDAFDQKITENKLSKKNIKVFFGPHIRRENFNVYGRILQSLESSRWRGFLQRQFDQAYFDLTAAAVDELVRIGLKKDNVTDCQIDTYRSEDYFSNRQKPIAENVKTFFTIIKRNA